MTTISFSRQLATGVAAFFVTALLVLSASPAERQERGLRLQRDQVSAQIFTALPQRHG
ncbi:hypothetical protein [Sphingomonas quercus]|uniref:Uncharacterized protein n=1 Tax=Sphingomonas quercus TaxID=2842451 RepID=A0ABS6BIJ5_9SPHN|nr:hypothetical protein [Sphingomonas quercus]MBU3078137.1 hypothetical protein [Sphingomonas quercus]